MQIFNIVEELEKERKKNKELEEENEELKSKLKATNKVLNDMDDIAGEYEERIDKAIDYIENNYNQICRYSEEENRYKSCDKELLNILGDNNE